MSKFLLIRHAHHDYIGKALASWLPGVHLSEAGREEAERLADALAGAHVDALYASPLERTMETAAPLARRLGLEIQPREAFGEVRFGDWTGREMHSLEQDPLWRRYVRFRSGTRAPAGEMLVEVQARMVAEMERIRAAHPDDTIAIVSHGDAIRSAVLHYAGMPLDFILRLEIGTASVTVIDVRDRGPKILLLNGQAPRGGGKLPV